jgi:hypothetical protein
VGKRTKRADRNQLGLTEKSAVTGEVVLTPFEKLSEMYRLCFTSDNGEAVLDDMKKRFGTRRSFVPDSNATAFHEGQRDVYLMILSFMERDVNRNPHEESTS